MGNDSFRDIRPDGTIVSGIRGSNFHAHEFTPWDGHVRQNNGNVIGHYNNFNDHIDSLNVPNSMKLKELG